MDRIKSILTRKKKDKLAWIHLDRCTSTNNNNHNHHNNNHNNNGHGGNSGHRYHSSDEASDDLIPEEIRSISQVADLSTSERRWLTTTLKIPPQLIETHLAVLLNVLNYLSRKQGVFYCLIPEEQRRRHSISRMFTSSRSRTPSTSSTPASTSPSLHSYGPSINLKCSGGSGLAVAVSAVPSSDVLTLQPRRRGDYNRIFIEPGRYHSFPEQESLAMARLVIEEEEPSRSFKPCEQSTVIKGAFGAVHHMLYSNSLSPFNNLEVALKKMDHKSERNRRYNLNEIAMLRYLKHPNVVGFVNAYENRDEELWMLMEYMDGGTIREAIQSFHL
ncbi:hypothetical protein SAMD00019534_114000 [Acytostelium subglobosum LB1]|uniref:hypothetical protein n=1 Tax=Acytostelium subglobosum LB1 TaxID=1410327 RepID=UPI000644E29D|nr:hypothetical protein SAMD00019534_114000 [Acytostelium subglobosum LB1]GAM28224.1 hypothetical protein SAMD00019534_114000 [Acytostelium subglobosum LB1]|eukprot:XP_012748858.1 hypothetical protein SAMD00019534_114000 [Acytostelium subglobosum LB1]